MAFTQDFRTQRRNYNDGQTRVGEIGRLWYDSETNTIRIGDGETEGGIIVGGGEGGGSYTLPTASTTVKGGVKVDGTTITIANQIISVGTVSYNSLTDKPTIPTSTNELSNDAGFITNSALTGFATETFVTTRGFITDVPEATASIKGGIKIGKGLTKNDDGTVDGFSGSYNDLTDKPTKTVTLYQDGVLQVTTGTVRWHNPFPLTIRKIIFRLATAADNTVSVRVKKTGQTFSTNNISAGDTKLVVDSPNLQMTTDDYLTVDVTAIGNTAKGSGLSVEFFYTLE